MLYFIELCTNARIFLRERMAESHDAFEGQLQTDSTIPSNGASLRYLEATSLELRYQAKISLLSRRLKMSTEQNNVNEHKESAQKLAAELADLAAVLAAHYRHYDNPRKCKYYNDEYNALIVAINLSNSHFRPSVPKQKYDVDYKNKLVSATAIRQLTGEINWYRLFFLVRLRRAFIAIDKIQSVCGQYHEFVKALDKMGPALNYIGWVFYVPRFLTNLGLVTKHLISGAPLTDELSKRWYELANDGVWLMVGLINCFALTGNPALFLTVGLYFFDILTSIGKSIQKIRHYDSTIKSLQKQAEALDVNSPKRQQIEQEINQLKSMKGHEKKQVKLNVGVAIGLFICMGMTALALAFPPAGVGLVVAAGITTLLICLFQKVMTKKLQKKQESAQALKLSEHGIFAQPVPTKQVNPPVPAQGVATEALKITTEDEDELTIRSDSDMRDCRAEEPNPMPIPHTINPETKA